MALKEEGEMTFMKSTSPDDTCSESAWSLSGQKPHFQNSVPARNAFQICALHGDYDMEFVAFNCACQIDNSDAGWTWHGKNVARAVL